MTWKTYLVNTVFYCKETPSIYKVCAEQNRCKGVFHCKRVDAVDIEIRQMVKKKVAVFINIISDNLPQYPIVSQVQNCINNRS